jgi:hypothetical protein
LWLLDDFFGGIRQAQCHGWLLASLIDWLIDWLTMCDFGFVLYTGRWFLLDCECTNVLKVGLMMGCVVPCSLSIICRIRKRMWLPKNPIQHNNIHTDRGERSEAKRKKTTTTNHAVVVAHHRHHQSHHITVTTHTCDEEHRKILSPLALG